MNSEQEMIARKLLADEMEADYPSTAERMRDPSFNTGHCASGTQAALRAIARALEQPASVQRRAPVQGYGQGTIPWSVHCLAWESYAKKYGKGQSAERIAERHGFGVEEMDALLPGWRYMADAIDNPKQPASAAGVEGWRPIETAPKTTRSILVWCPDVKCTFVVSWFTPYDEDDDRPEGWLYFGPHFSALHHEPTHWMPLPAAPKPEDAS